MFDELYQNLGIVVIVWFCVHVVLTRRNPLHGNVRLKSGGVMVFPAVSIQRIADEDELLWFHSIPMIVAVAGIERTRIAIRRNNMAFWNVIRSHSPKK